VIGRIGFAELLIIPVMFAIPAIILYFIIKMAVKNAIKESKRENIL
jgi:hypothetical protein